MRNMLLLFLIAFTSCTATKLTSSWTAPQAGARDYKRIMVVGIMEDKDSALRRKIERHLANDLHAIGYNAFSYREMFREDELRNMRYDSVRKRLSEKGIDGVITFGLMASEKESVYVIDRGSNNTDALPLGSFWERPRMPVKQEQGKPGYYLTTTTYYWESNFYDVSTIDLLYNSRSTAFEVTSIESLAHKYGKMIVKDLQKKYVLSDQRRSTQIKEIKQWIALQLLKTTSPLLSFMQTISLR
ncbi:MAG: hypothetical protein EOO10_14945 [Chitinophagaceae bacterium]|nr:MAG: hypothetical protein EOO10_14945 [Chitinophagaceae bacterium]